MARRKQNIKIDGLNELIKNLGKLDNTARLTIKNGSKKSSEEVQKTAKQLAPKDSGELKNSIKTREENSPEGKSVYQVYPAGESEGGVRYGFVYEYGAPNRNIPAQPFMRPAVKKNQKLIKQNIKEAIEQAIERL